MTGSEADEGYAAYVRSRQPALLRSALLLTNDHAAAQDLLQDALIKLASRWPEVKDGYPDAYVRRILYHDHVSRWRRTRRETITDLSDDRHRPYGVSEPVDPGEAVTGLDVRKALQQVTAKQRAVIVLRFYEDRTQEQIAETLGVSVGTVKSQIHAALARLRQVLPQASEAFASAEETR